ncbi:MAG: ribonuclease III domain-containing protein [Clostridia bacterium]|jgi:ribonuclease-3 family protein|nr:ribonuclease III domain-containing protein [Clostridia bacterium]MDD3231844.1 ribonuclease III domain-containing protein [Clostridia bacterium]MDD3862886.1 ribonuclease III domain-containing protein [Clostridia bacterium]MDD4408719.1 ribonuclease III domain-containing protein [Clostridia bacterium]
MEINNETNDLLYLVPPNLNAKEIINISPLLLAFIGDAVHTLFVRSYFLKNSAGTTPNKQHKLCSGLCRAEAQGRALDFISPFLNDDELDIARRARNSKNHSGSKNTSVEDYKKATAFEALVGFLYLTGQNKRLENLLLNFYKNTEK